MNFRMRAAPITKTAIGHTSRSSARLTAAAGGHREEQAPA